MNTRLDAKNQRRFQGDTGGVIFLSGTIKNIEWLSLSAGSASQFTLSGCNLKVEEFNNGGNVINAFATSSGSNNHLEFENTIISNDFTFVRSFNGKILQIGLD